MGSYTSSTFSCDHWITLNKSLPNGRTAVSAQPIYLPVILHFLSDSIWANVFQAVRKQKEPAIRSSLRKQALRSYVRLYNLLVFNSTISTMVSLLHLGQCNGRFRRTVWKNTFSLVFLLHIGHRTQWELFFPCMIILLFHLLVHFLFHMCFQLNASNPL